MRTALVVAATGWLVASPCAAGIADDGAAPTPGALPQLAGEGSGEVAPDLFRFRLDRSCSPFETANSDAAWLPSCAPPAQNLMRPHIAKVREAAEAGSPYDQFVLGFVHWMGRRAPRDPVLAHMWLSLAAGNGHLGAQWAKKALAAEMSAAQIAEAERLARAWRERHR